MSKTKRKKVNRILRDPGVTDKAVWTLDPRHLFQSSLDSLGDSLISSRSREPLNVIVNGGFTPLEFYAIMGENEIPIEAKRMFTKIRRTFGWKDINPEQLKTSGIFRGMM